MEQQTYFDNVFFEMLKQYEAAKDEKENLEKQQLESSDPRTKINAKIDKMFKDFEDTILSKNNKMKCVVHEDIYGPIGASRIIDFDTDDFRKRINKRFYQIEMNLEMEKEKLRIVRKNILDDLDNQQKK